MSHLLKSHLFFGFFILMTAACAKKTSVINAQPLENEVLSPEKESLRAPVLDSIHGQAWRWYYGKFSVNYADKDRKLSVKLSLKCANDSAANALISFAGIPFINSLITQDKIEYLNKKDRCYGAQPISSLKNILGIELSLDNLQELFLGLPVAYSTTSSLQQVPDHRLDTVTYLQSDSTLTVRYSYDKKTHRIVEQEIQLSDGRRMNITYLSWNEGRVATPSSTVISVVENGNDSTVKLMVDRYELNVPQEISLEIPADYEKCP
jgi:outer membrane biogenesis lipoprotein LolB